MEQLGASLADRLAQALGRNSAPADDDADDYGRRPRSVPYDRLQREIDKRRQLEADLADLGARFEQLQTGYQGRIGELQASTAEQLKAIGTRHAEDIALIDAGLTDAMGRQVVRQAWESMPKEGRSKSPAAWWQSTLEAHAAHLADPEQAAAPNVPRPLTPYLPAPEPAPEPQANRRGSMLPREPRPREAASLDSLPTDDVAGFLAGLRRMS